MRKRRVVEADGQELPSGIAGALPGGSDFDRAGLAPGEDAVVRTLAVFALRRAECACGRERQSLLATDRVCGR